MAYARLLERENPPDDVLIRKTIGREVLPVWDDVLEFLSRSFPSFEVEQLFYSAQHGWAWRYRKGSDQLLLLFPERGAFSALITLSPEEESQAMAKINYFNNRIREALNQPSAIPQGRWLWLRLEDHTDFVGLQLLLEIKAG